jgi:antagonist of KipI
VTIAVTDGPHRAQLPDLAEALLGVEWVVGGASDRAGLRLEPLSLGERPAPIHGHALDSFGLTWGAIEVPPDGVPIVLLPDGPTVGGYPVPLVVARVDLPRLGQLRGGDRVRLRHVRPEEARAEWLAADAMFEQARAALAVMRSVW